MKENLEQLTALVAGNISLKGSIIGEILLAMESGRFTDINQEVDSSKEKVIGEMNNLDKALNKLCYEYSGAEKKFVCYFRNVILSDDFIESEKNKQMIADLQRVRERFNIFSNLLWAEIKNRFTQLNHETTNFGIRSGYRIVLIKDDSLPDLLKAILNL